MHYELLEKTREEIGVDANLRWRGSPSVGRGLHELCEVIGADLLVVGSSRQGLLGRVLIGDSTRAALNGAPCAIAITPAGFAQQPVAMREIRVAYNGSPESEHAISVAREIAAESGAKLSAFEAVSLPTYTFLGGPVPVDDAVESLVDDARKADRGVGRRGTARGVRPARRGTRGVQRLARSADRRLARLRADRAPDARKHLAAACAHRPLPRSGAGHAPLRAIEAHEAAEDSRDATVAVEGVTMDACVTIRDVIEHRGLPRRSRGYGRGRSMRGRRRGFRAGVVKAD